MTKNVLYEINDALDIFSTNSYLTLNKKRTLTSTFGGVLTIIVVIIIFYQTISEVVSMLKYQDPQVYQITDLEDIPSSTSMGPSNNFFLAVLLEVGGTFVNISEVSPFRFPTNYVRVRTEGDSVTEYPYPILWRPCNQSDFPASIYGNETYSADEFDLAYCAYGINFTDSETGKCASDISQEKYPDCVTLPTFEIQGTSTSASYDYIQSNLYVCDSTDPSMPTMKCTTDDVAALFDTIAFNVDLYFGNNMAVSNNYKAPNTTFVDDLYWSIDSGIQKTAYIYVDKVTVQDYDDFVWTSAARNRSYFIVDSAGMRELQKIGSTSSQLLQWNIIRSNNNIVIIRDYTKIEDILSDLGGFSKAAMFVAAFLAIGYIRYKYQIKIANGIYDFYVPKENNDDVGKAHNKPPKAEKSIFEQSQGVMSIDFSESKMLKRDISASSPKSSSGGGGDFGSDKPIQDYFRDLKNRKTLENRLRHYCKLLLGSMSCKKKDSHMELTTKARTLATTDLDLPQLIKKLNEVDRLKALFLNLEQKEAFEFIPKPLLHETHKGPLHLDSLRISTVASMSAKLAMKQRESSLADYSEIKSSTSKLRMKKTSIAELVPREDFSSLSKYGKLYTAYRHLLEDEDRSNLRLNKKLLATLDPNLLKMFKRVDEVLGDEYTVRDFEDVVNQALKENINR